MNSKIRNYSALAVATAAVVPLACKKDDNANIRHVTLNKTIVGVGTTSWEAQDSVDLNSDGVFDFYLVTAAGLDYYGDDYTATYIYGLQSGNDIVSNNITILSQPTPFATPKNSGDQINSSSTIFSYYAYFSAKSIDNSFNEGINGDGDKYIGFRFKIGGDTHYGWAKVNVSADHKTIILKEYAYNEDANSGIGVGDE